MDLKLLKAKQYFQAEEYEKTAKILNGLVNHRDVRICAEANLVLGFLHYNELGVPKKPYNKKLAVQHWSFPADQRVDLPIRIEALIKLAAAENDKSIARRYLNDCLSCNPSTEQQKRIFDLFEEFDSQQTEENEDHFTSENNSIEEQPSSKLNVKGCSVSSSNGNGLNVVDSYLPQEAISSEIDKKEVKKEPNLEEPEEKKFISDEAWIEAAYSIESENKFVEAESLWQSLLKTTTDLHVKLMVRNHLKNMYKIVIQ